MKKYREQKHLVDISYQGKCTKGFINFTHGDERASKSIKTPLSSNPILFNTFTAKGFSETRPFMHLSKHIFGSI